MEPSEEKQSDPLAEGIKSKLRDHFDHVREKINKEDAIKLAKNFEKKFNGVRDKYRDHPTLGALVRQCELLYWVMRDWVKGEYEMPWFAIAAITASLLYVISPIDFIPDFIPVIGYLDDLFIVLLCVKLIREELKKYCDQKGLDRNLYKLG